MNLILGYTYQSYYNPKLNRFFYLIGLYLEPFLRSNLVSWSRKKPLPCVICYDQNSLIIKKNPIKMWNSLKLGKLQLNTLVSYRISLLSVLVYFLNSIHVFFFLKNAKNTRVNFVCVYQHNVLNSISDCSNW